MQEGERTTKIRTEKTALKMHNVIPFMTPWKTSPRMWVNIEGEREPTKHKSTTITKCLPGVEDKEKHARDHNRVEIRAPAELMWTMILVPSLSCHETLDKFPNPSESPLLPPLANVGFKRIFLKGSQ